VGAQERLGGGKKAKKRKRRANPFYPETETKEGQKREAGYSRVNKIAVQEGKQQKRRVKRVGWTEAEKNFSHNWIKRKGISASGVKR